MADINIVPSYGVEIELDYNFNTVPDGWRKGYDGSLRARCYNQPDVATFITVNNKLQPINMYSTCELKSPVLVGSDTFQAAMMNSLDWAMTDTNHTCGLHIHVGLRRVFSTGTSISINLPKLAADRPAVMNVLSRVGNEVYEWVSDNDTNRRDNRFCRRGRTLHPDGERLMMRELARPRARNGGLAGFESYGLTIDHYADTLLRPKYNTVEFRSPSPRVDRNELAQFVASKVDADIIPVVKDCLSRKSAK